MLHALAVFAHVPASLQVGRLPTCDIPLEHLSVSRAHAHLTTDGAGNLFLTDLGSGALVAHAHTLVG